MTQGKARKQLPMVLELLQQDPKMGNVKIAELTGLFDEMERESALDYVMSVKQNERRKQKKREQAEALAQELEAKAKEFNNSRIEDLKKLIDSRKGRMKRSAAYNLLLLNCYYRLKSQDDDIHWRAIDHTYEVNENLQYPFTTSEAIKICETAIDKYMKNKEGIDYSPVSLYYMLDVREEELPILKTISKPDWY